MEKRGIVIWGAGNSAKKLMQTCEQLSPLFFLDNDPQKQGGDFLGYKVKSPLDNDVALFDKSIIVASIHYDEISNQLKRFGLIEGLDFVSWERLICFDVNIRKDFCQTISENLDRVARHVEQYNGKSILFFCLTAYDALDKGLKRFFDEWSVHQENGNLILAQEATWLSAKENSELVAIPVLSLPKFCGKGEYLAEGAYYIQRNRFYPVEKEKFCDCEDFVKADESLTLIAENLRLKYPKMLKGYEFLLVYYLNQYFGKLFKMITPLRIYLWNEFYAVHKLIEVVAKKLDICVRYIEYGNIPGTIQVDKFGQMGESFPATHSREFIKLKVSSKEIENAKTILHYLYLSKENRKKQPKGSAWGLLKDRLVFGNPVVLYAGQNDYESGLRPYNCVSEKYHSPIFKSSDEAVIFLAEICKRNNWNLIYKPHPIMAKAGTALEAEMPPNVLTVDNVDINEIIDMADVVITILSTTAYVGLIRKKPVLMLGFTHLKDKGCTYQAFRIEDVEHFLIMALHEGFSKSQRKAFAVHLAQMNRYYLYDDLQKKRIPYGKSITEKILDEASFFDGTVD